MELLNNLALGFGVAFTAQNLLYAFFGAVLGTLIGVLPGLGPVATIAMLLPSIYALDATPALIMLAGIYYGAQYGGSTTAILINVPGESSSVVTASVAGILGNRGQVNYSAAKAGLHGATKALALEVASRGITVNAVAPGVIDTPMLAESFPLERIKQLVPLGRAGRPEEVAAMVAFLCSEQAGYISGQIISVDGAMT